MTILVNLVTLRQFMRKLKEKNLLTKFSKRHFYLHTKKKRTDPRFKVRIGEKPRIHPEPDLMFSTNHQKTSLYNGYPAKKITMFFINLLIILKHKFNNLFRNHNLLTQLLN